MHQLDDNFMQAIKQKLNAEIASVNGTTWWKKPLWGEDRSAIVELASRNNVPGLKEIVSDIDSGRVIDPEIKAELGEGLCSAAGLGQLSTVQFLCELIGDNKPSAEDVGDALIHAARNGQLSIVKYFCELTGGNKPGAAEIGVALSHAAANGRPQVVQYFRGLIGGNKPSADAVDQTTLFGAFGRGKSQRMGHKAADEVTGLHGAGLSGDSFKEKPRGTGGAKHKSNLLKH